MSLVVLRWQIPWSTCYIIYSVSSFPAFLRNTKSSTKNIPVHQWLLSWYLPPLRSLSCQWKQISRGFFSRVCVLKMYSWRQYAPYKTCSLGSLTSPGSILSSKNFRTHFCLSSYQKSCQFYLRSISWKYSFLSSATSSEALRYLCNHSSTFSLDSSFVPLIFPLLFFNSVNTTVCCYSFAKILRWLPTR